MSKDGFDVVTRRILRLSALVASALLIAGCAANNARFATAPARSEFAPAPVRSATGWKAASVRHVRTRTLRTVRATRATPRSFDGYASYYSEGTRVASGGRYRPNALTAAHRSLPFGTRVRVRDVRTGRSVVVVINDRGPFVHGRVLDLSLGAAKALGIEGRGVNRIHADVL